jgi:hypothetical protein
VAEGAPVIEPIARIRDIDLPEGRLDRVRWQGSAAYRILSCSFAVRWNRKAVGDYLGHVLGGFEVGRDGPTTPTGSDLVTYSVLGPGGGDPYYRVLVGDLHLLHSERPAEVLNHLFWHVYSMMLERTTELLLIHAGSLLTPDGQGVLLPAVSGSGKSTLVTALVEAGFGYLSDEVAAIDPVTGMVHAYPRALNLKLGSLGLFPRLEAARRRKSSFESNHRFVRPEELREDCVVASTSVRFVIAPRYQRGAETRLVQLTRAAATALLWNNCMNLAASRAQPLPLLASLTRRARTYRLVSGDLEQAVRAVVGVTGSRSGT